MYENIFFNHKIMAPNETVLRFDQVSFEFIFPKLILDNVSFNVRSGSKITIMGQN